MPRRTCYSHADDLLVERVWGLVRVQKLWVYGQLLRRLEVHGFEKVSKYNIGITVLIDMAWSFKPKTLNRKTLVPREFRARFKLPTPSNPGI